MRQLKMWQQFVVFRYEDIKSAINMTQAFAGGKKKRIWHKKDGYALDAER